MILELAATRRAVASGIGLTSIDPVTTDVVSFVEEHTGGAGAAVAVAVSGSAGIATATSVPAARGRLEMVAIHWTAREDAMSASTGLFDLTGGPVGSSRRSRRGYRVPGLRGIRPRPRRGTSGGWRVAGTVNANREA